jgi:rhodanese-related sulfurtransferase
LTDPDSYAGDKEVLEAWHLLTQNPNAVLIDVRTHAEWSYVGVPMFEDPARDVILVEWLSYPAMQVNADFGERLKKELDERNILPDAPLFFLCRSGVRSLHAAIEITKSWQGPCYNIASGFEGDMDSKLQRGHCNGWKQAGLPWRQF